MKSYNPKTIEPKWQKLWADTKLYAAVTGDKTRDKYYMLTEFPYPSGAGLHAGHTREYTLGDVMARHRRMQGYNVLYPMGYDAFGLPTENYAIKHKIAPQQATAENVATFRQQFDAMGFSFDWDREVNTTDPKFYKWTQWLFLKFYAAGLAYQHEMPINWCPKEKTGLANEEVVNGVHERCGTPVEKKLLKQWMLRITDYADRLIEGLKAVDYPPRIADQQVNWIGRSEGAEIDFVVGAKAAHAPKDSLKFTPELTKLILDGKKTTTIRLEPKQLKVGDYATFMTRFSPSDVKTFAQAKITQVETKVLRDIPIDLDGHEPFASQSGQLAAYRGYYGDSIGPDTEFTIYYFASVEPIITAYTTRADTLAGATFLVLAPEHPLVEAITTDEHRARVTQYIQDAQAKSEIDRQNTDRKKTGVFTGAYAKNPITGGKMPVWVADYVLYGYGTGAIMAVPAHDERDGAFAKEYNLPIIPVMTTPASDKTALLLHGAEGHSQENWLPWTKAQLEAFGYKVIVPDLPDSSHPDLNAWVGALEPYAKELSQHSVIVAHSLGAPTAAHFLLKHQLKIDKLLWVAPTVPNADWDWFKREFKWDSVPGIEAIAKAPFDRAALGKLVRQMVIFGSKTDPYIPFESLRAHADHTLPFARFVTFPDSGHFNQAAGITALPEALAVLVNDFFTGYGPLINSGQFDGLEGDEAKRAIVKFLEDQGVARTAVKYKLRDWIFSRQHYWGEPIPIIHCPKDGVVPVPEDQLPVTLPVVENYEPTESGASPLAAITDWVNTTCPKCGGSAKRETDTMPNWAGSNWYYLRYMDPHNDQAFAGPEPLKYWGMADLYLGGMEHTTLHLLYSRFVHQFLYDQKLVPLPEPYAARRGQGIVLAADGRKMSKSIGNVVNPTDIIATHGADTLRLYILFMAPYDETTPWSEERLNGASRFVYKVWTLAQELMDAHQFTRAMQPGPGDAFETAVDRMIHKTIKKVHDDLHEMRFNTAVSALMEYVNFLSSADTKPRLLQTESAALAWRALNTLVQLLAPITPHLSEELWRELGYPGSVHVSGWPMYDPDLIKDDFINVVVQVNGKVRAQLTLPAVATEADLTEAAKADPKLAKYLEGATILKTIVIPRKVVNFVVKP